MLIVSEISYCKRGSVHPNSYFNLHRPPSHCSDHQVLVHFKS